MQYDISRNEVKRILTSANILNTLNGGMVESRISVNRDNEEYNVTVSLPGIGEDSLRVEIVDKHLIISHEMEFAMGDNKLVVVPHVLAACPLNLNIDHSRISADYKDGELEVSLPLSDFTSGYRREIRITKD